MVCSLGLLVLNLMELEKTGEVSASRKRTAVALDRPVNCAALYCSTPDTSSAELRRLQAVIEKSSF
jgi:hypothetical protein